MSARTTALSALVACRKQGAWADGILKEYIARDRLDRRDAALASRLCYGVLQNRMLLDYHLKHLLSCSMNKLQPVVPDILRLGLYQILMMDKIPASAAVNEAVEQGKRYANRGAAGLINGVLRRAVREKDSLNAPEDLSIRYSHPRGLVELLEDSVGKDALAPLLASHNEPARTTIQVNTLVTGDEDVLQALTQAGADAEPHPWLEHAYYISGYGNLENIPLFRQGGFFVQDPAARLAVEAADIRPNMQVLDGCAAPGGKSFAAALAMNNQGHIYSCDIHPHKIDLLRSGAARLRIDVMEPVLQDATQAVPAWEQSMDVVIADVPCSGLGVIRKKPDIRYKDLEALQNLPAVQKRILNQLSAYVKPGGILLYSTCTILKRENEDIIRWFLEQHPQFSSESFPLPSGFPGQDSNEGMLTLLPSIHKTDGFFICKLRRAQ